MSSGSGEVLASADFTSISNSPPVTSEQRSLVAIYGLVIVVLVSVLVYLLIKPSVSLPLTPGSNVRETVAEAPLESVSDIENSLVSSDDLLLIEAEPHALPEAEPEIVEATLVEPKLVKIAVAEKERIEKESIEEESIVEEKLEVLSIEQANESLLSQIPNISITSHIYSSQAKRRSIVVNDERLVEGDFIAPQVQVEEITHQGMILKVNDSLLAVSRSRGWNR
jgi:hypothetical protein